MYSRRYGSLTNIAHRTDCRCHLCHLPVDLATYGRVRRHRGRAASVDHIWPQSWGVDDDPENLRIAHQRCNSIRGTRDVEETRLMLAGTTREPWSATAWNLATVGGGVGAGYVAGNVFATNNDEGETEFNWGAAVVAGLSTAALVTALRMS